MNTYRIQIEGLVQGVGFRPFVYRLANNMKLNGTVENRNDGVLILVNAETSDLDNMVKKIRSDAPSHSRIERLQVEKIGKKYFPGFKILISDNISDDITSISPDIAVCPDCLYDMEHQEHRREYPLINCTNCGPRFSIIKGVPYDRSMTTMAEFSMCKKCSGEYEDINDRRFHAQPVACNSCGPYYTIHLKEGPERDISGIVTTASELLSRGEVVALKGTGGYHLLCDACNELSVATLRESKGRERKPFAVMCRDLKAVEKIALLNTTEKEILTSWRRPVVLLDGKGCLAPSVSNGLDSVGVILPYMPFHYLLFNKLKHDTIVFTSANLSDEPVIISDAKAMKELTRISSALITYNREIFNRTDDSVSSVINGKECVIRRSRGYAPSPVNIDLRVEGIFGAGAELTNCYAIGKGKQVILSQHIGDLRNDATFNFYKSSYNRLSEMFRFRPSVIAKDMHPDYLSSAFALEIAEDLDIHIEEVQHHHAHIASCMAENGLGDKVIGVAFDGVGLGTDGNIWGGEFMIAGHESFERVMHFEYVKISGADKISPEPWRSGMSYLKKYSGDTAVIGKLKLGKIGEERLSLYPELIEKNINTSLCSGAGRLFDAVAAITGISLFSSYHAEAPMLLQSVIKRGVSRYYGYEIIDNRISFGKTIREIVADIENKITTDEISAAFHNTVAMATVDAVRMISRNTGIKHVALSGGTFQNKYLAEKIIVMLSDEKYLVYFHNQVPPNDGGIALGQIAVAAARNR